jgi:hypothetical protein
LLEDRKGEMDSCDYRSMLCTSRHLQYIGPQDKCYIYKAKEETHCIHAIEEYLFQGSANASRDSEVLKYHNIHAVVNGIVLQKIQTQLMSNQKKKLQLQKI